MMKRKWWTLAVLMILGLLLWTIESGESGVLIDSGFGSIAGTAPGAKVPLLGPVVTVQPKEIHEILYNPGMGFADFHFGFGNPPPPEQIPRQTVAYFRWSWADLEPVGGEYNFALVDRVIEQAKSKGESLAFRIMAESRAGSPQWLLNKGIASVPVSDGAFPDFNNPIFLDYHERLIKAFGARYAGSSDIDHIDIGSVGCWGEWNTACCQGVEAQCKQYFPTEEHQIKITDWYFTYFPNTPLVMLHGGQLSMRFLEGPAGAGTVLAITAFSAPTGITWSMPTPACLRTRSSPTPGNGDPYSSRPAA